MSKNNQIIVFDTETTGFSPAKNEIVQLSYILYDTELRKVIYATKQEDDIVNINGNIPIATTNVHGITKNMTKNKRPIKEHMDEFIFYCDQASQFVGHNIRFDINMIVGQINKILPTLTPEELEKYTKFLTTFQMIGQQLPDAAYCTMEESKGICAQIRGTNKLKKEKLMEVHKLLFNQDVRGQLHNALVDISVTLRVFLKLTDDIDICEGMSKLETVANVTNNNEICNLINPVNIDRPIENIDYSGELITGLTVIPDGLEEDKIMVKSIYNDLATAFVKNTQEQAMSNVLNKVAPSQVMCTDITICHSILKSGLRKGKECRRPAKYEGFCQYHKPKGDSTKIVPTNESDELQTPVKINIKKTPKETAKSYVKNLFNYSVNNKVVPLGGKRKTKKQINRRTRKKRQHKKRQHKKR